MEVSELNINIAIVDDQMSDRERLRHDVQFWLHNRGISGDIKLFSDGESLLEKFSANDFHIIFLDIYMNALNGIETARNLRSADTNLLIIFLTSSMDFAFEAFAVHPFEYVIKPYNLNKLNEVLAEAIRVLTTEEKIISVRVSYGEYSIPVRNITAVLSQGHNIKIVLADGQKIICNMTFGEVEGLLNSERRFLLCNRGILINMDHVDSIDGEFFVMRNSERYQIKVRGRLKVISDFSQYKILKMRGGVI